MTGYRLDPATKRARIDRREAIKARFDRLEQFEQSLIVNQIGFEHVPNVRLITRVKPFDFRQSLTIEIIMIKIDLAESRDEYAAFLPPGQWRYKVVGRGQFDIDVEVVLQFW